MHSNINEIGNNTYLDMVEVVGSSPISPTTAHSRLQAYFPRYILGLFAVYLQTIALPSHAEGDNGAIAAGIETASAMHDMVAGHDDDSDDE